MTSRHGVRLLEVNEITTEPVETQLVRGEARSIDETVRLAFGEYEDRIYGMLLASSRDPELAADVTQESFLRLLTEARAGRYPENAGAWLYRVAANLLVSGARRAAVARRLMPRTTSLQVESDTPEAVAVRREGSRATGCALAQLTLVERAALLMAAQGVSGEQIAAHLGKSHGATRTLMLRARRKLRRLLAEREAPR